MIGSSGEPKQVCIVNRPVISRQPIPPQKMDWRHCSAVPCHLHLSHADPEVTLVELVRNVPAKRTKLSSFLYQTVEEAQSKQHLLPSLFLHTTTLTALCKFARFKDFFSYLRYFFKNFFTRWQIYGTVCLILLHLLTRSDLLTCLNLEESKWPYHNCMISKLRQTESKALVKYRVKRLL